MQANATRDPRPIGVFDSGVGGLTVLRALRERLPREGLLYLGDTARVPYGTKSAQTVTRYAERATGMLVDRDVKAIVVACNSASALALESLCDRFDRVPIIGVIEPGVDAVARAGATAPILILATEATVRSGVYQRRLRTLAPEREVIACACPMMVALAETGWTRGPVVEGVVRRSIEEGGGRTPGAVLLGCTHFPVLREPIRAVLGAGVAVVDSASTTADATAHTLEQRGLLAPSGSAGADRFMATDGAERFARVSRLFLDRAIRPGDVELVDLI